MSNEDQELDVMFYWGEDDSLVLRVFTPEEMLEYDFDDEETFKLFSFLQRKLEEEEKKETMSLISRIFSIFSK